MRRRKIKIWQTLISLDRRGWFTLVLPTIECEL
jgi:hypothetical protein